MIDGIVLDIQPLESDLRSKPLRVQQRSKARAQSQHRLAFDRQQFAVAPEVARTRLDRFMAYRLLDRCVVVIDFERTEAGFAHVKGAHWVLLPALAALEIDDVTAHGILCARLSGRPLPQLFRFRNILRKGNPHAAALRLISAANDSRRKWPCGLPGAVFLRARVAPLPQPGSRRLDPQPAR